MPYTDRWVSGASFFNLERNQGEWKGGIVWLVGKVRAAMFLQLCVAFLYRDWVSCFKGVCSLPFSNFSWRPSCGLSGWAG